MTMQMLDSFIYKREPAEAIAISRRFSFTPLNTFGIETAPWATSNYRGFRCDYDIDESLVIKNLYLFSKNHSYPLINGNKAEEIPEYTSILSEINKKARVPKRYLDGFPMQYMGINYEYEYSGKIVLGVNPKRGVPEGERYLKVVELCFVDGILTESSEITDLWRSANEQKEKKSTRYWWEEKENSYAYLVNLAEQEESDDYFE